MKSIAFLVIISLSSVAWADAEYAYDGEGLTPKEEEALRLAREWTDRPIKPIQTTGGKVVYVYGATMPTIIGAPMQISDIELEAGEAVNEILVGDTARWLVESGSSGGGITHVFVKPLDVGLTTSLVVTTNKRTYHIKLLSRASGHTPYVGFIYNEQIMAAKSRENQRREWRTTEIEGQTVDLSGLDFDYRVDGRAAWKPARVYNDGRQTFIKLPDSAANRETPVLLAMRGKTEQMVNYRFRNNTFEVDGLFDHLTLVSGVGRDQERVDVKRSVK